MGCQPSLIPHLCIVVPCFNEEDSLEHTYKVLMQVIERLATAGYASDGSCVLFVDDGSTDNTWGILKELRQRNGRLRAIKLSRNFGHQNALFAGLLQSRQFANCVVSIDADLQQDPWTICEFIEEYRKGHEIVLGVRENRETDGPIKMLTAWAYYTLMRLFGVTVVANHADFRLLGNRALQALSEYQEYNLFLRSLVMDLGFKHKVVKFSVSDRLYGETKYTPARMFRLALDGITSFTSIPLRFFSAMGFLILLLSGVSLAYVLFIKTLGIAVPGWASTLLPIYLIGGFNSLGIGLLGEYIAKIYSETKRRPRYIIEEQL